MARVEVLGLVCIVFAVQCSVVANTFAKLLSKIPVLQLMQARFLLQWFCSISLSMLLKSCGHTVNLTGVPGCRRLLAARAATYTCAIGALWCALRFLPVGQATALVYLHPIMCGLLARYFLHEKLGRLFWAQAVLSCFGVWFVANADDISQSHSTDVRGVVLAMLSCCCFATGNCLVRFLPAVVHPLEVQVYTDSLIGLFVMPVLLVVSGSAGDWGTWNVDRAALLAVFTAFGLGTSFLAIAGFKMAPATKAALFMYLEVPSAFAVQVFFFSQVPTTSTLLGATCITFAALSRLAYEIRFAADGKVPSEMLVSPLGSPVMSPITAPFGNPLVSPLLTPQSISPFDLPKSLLDSAVGEGSDADSMASTQ